MDLSDAEPVSDFEDTAIEDRDIMKKSRQALGLARNYVPYWTSSDAFREYFQNWMDGMIQAHKLTRDSIKIVTKDSNDEWVATAHQSRSGVMIGFILFLKKKGCLELCNFKSQLPRKALDIGVSSKRTSENLAGTHGEGFKVASLVMVRKGYQVRYESSKFYWSFQFGGRDKRHLYCSLTPMKDSVIEKRMLAESARILAKKPRQLISNVWEDVSVKIGKVYSTKGTQIETAKFMEWIKVSFELNRPIDCIKAPDGDLVLNQKFGGRIYLKGLYIGGSITSKNLRFGYNLGYGNVNRDRARLIGADQEATILAKIWGHAILTGQEKYVTKYTKMLLEDDAKQWADVNLAQDNISKSVAEKIWKHLLTCNPLGEVFYYNSPKQEDEDVRVIKTELKMRPVSVPNGLWKLLVQHGLAQTPKEYCHRLMECAPVSKLEDSTYIAGVKRALASALALDTRTENLTVIFKDNSKAEIDLLILGSELLINDKWLDYNKTHKNGTCFLWEYGMKEPEFPCDHTISRLYGIIISKISTTPLLDRSTLESESSLREMLNENLRQMPRMIHIRQGKSTGQLEIVWTGLESKMVWRIYGVEMMCRITLHLERTCKDRKADLLFRSANTNTNKFDCEDEHGTSDCGCLYKIVSLGRESVVFDRLDSGEEYFPMVSLDRDQAFFGVPPKPVRPPSQNSKNIGPSGKDYEHVKSVTNSDNEAEKSQEYSLEAAPTPKEELQADANNGDGKSSDSVNVGKIAPRYTHEQSQENPGLEAAPPSTAEHVSPRIHAVEPKSYLRVLQQQAAASDQELYLAKKKLAKTLAALEERDFELRQAKAKSEAKIQGLSSMVEDLRGEIHQMHETEAERAQKMKEDASRIENLQFQILKLYDYPVQQNHGAQRSLEDIQETKKVSENSAVQLEQPKHDQRDAEAAGLLRIENRSLRRSNESLQTEIKQVREDHGSMAGTLKNLSDMMQGVLNLTTQEQMASMLQGIQGLIKGTITLSTRMASAERQVAEVKRGREDDNDATPPTRHPKKNRTAAIIKHEYAIDLSD
ncbi:hypothetical protein QTJ16_003335 [Diplocarpon rosae]|uniref:Uncharacterized protein n=1 Tax=Diplocarpon rosae TaxID=946125 RepID=A0AAD9T2H3_9HELO|nr:hypothetical protein QTJ16_003335 [Diplocarpon rosae]